MAGPQVAAADRIVRNVKRYGLLGNIEDAHYVRYTIDAARVAGLSPEVQPAFRRPSCGKTNVASVAAGALVLEGKSSVTTGDSDNILGGKSDGAGRKASNGLHAQRKRGGEGGGTGKGCAGGLDNPNSDYLEVKFCDKKYQVHVKRDNKQYAGDIDKKQEETKQK